MQSLTYTSKSALKHLIGSLFDTGVETGGGKDGCQEERYEVETWIYPAMSKVSSSEVRGYVRVPYGSQIVHL